MPPKSQENELCKYFNSSIINGGQRPNPERAKNRQFSGGKNNIRSLDFQYVVELYFVS